jgi:hypothetical protein
MSLSDKVAKHAFQGSSDDSHDAKQVHAIWRTRPPVTSAPIRLSDKLYTARK